MKGADFEGKEMKVEQTSKGDSRGSDGEGSRDFGSKGRERFGDRNRKKEGGFRSERSYEKKGSRDGGERNYSGEKRSSRFSDSKEKKEFGFRSERTGERSCQKKNLVQTNAKNPAKVNLKLLVLAEEKVQNAQDQEENKFNYRIE